MRLPIRWPGNRGDASAEAADALERAISAPGRGGAVPANDALVTVANALQAAAREAPPSPRADELRAELLAGRVVAPIVARLAPLRVAAVVGIGAVIGIGAASAISGQARDMVLAPIEGLVELFTDAKADGADPSVPVDPPVPSELPEPAATPRQPSEPPDQASEPDPPAEPSVDPPAAPPNELPMPPDTGPPNELPMPPDTGPPNGVPAP